MSSRVEDLELPRVTPGAENPTREEYLREVANLRSQSWIGRSDFGYVVYSHTDAVALLRERRLHQASQLVGRMIAGTGTALDQLEESNGILSAEGADHTRLRRLVAQPFSPKAVDLLRPFMRDYVTTKLQGIPLGSVFEFQSMFNEYPIAVICHHLGVGEKDWDRFSYWADLLFIRWSPLIIGREQEFVDAMTDFRNYCIGLIEERRADPGADLLSQLIEAEEEGDRLSTDELISMVQGIIAAGTDTTRNQLGILMTLLAERPDTWATLREDSQLIDGAVEESLRFMNPIRTVIRQVAEDFEFRDIVFSKGQLIAFSLASANRDESLYPDNDSYDITRVDAKIHLTFSSGIHHCLGAALARAELQEALKVFLHHWASIALTEPPRWKHGRLAIWGPAEFTIEVS